MTFVVQTASFLANHLVVQVSKCALSLPGEADHTQIRRLARSLGTAPPDLHTEKDPLGCLHYPETLQILSLDDMAQRLVLNDFCRKSGLL